MCAGTNAGLLHAAGCSNDQITAWCTSIERNNAVGSTHPPHTRTAGESETLVIAGSDSSLSSLPALVVLEPITGDVQWTMTLNISGLPGSHGMESVSASSSSESDQVSETRWSISPLWVEPTAGNENGGYSIYVSGLHTERAEEQHRRRRRRVQIPPPPPVTFYDYYTWRVDSN